MVGRRSRRTRGGGQARFDLKKLALLLGSWLHLWHSAEASIGLYRAVLWPGKFLTAIGSESARPQFHFGAPILPVIIASMHHTPWHGARHTAHHLISIHDDCGRGGGEAARAHRSVGSNGHGNELHRMGRRVGMNVALPEKCGSRIVSLELRSNF